MIPNAISSLEERIERNQINTEDFDFEDWKKEILKTLNIAMNESYELKKKAKTEEEKKLAINIQCAIDNAIDFLV